MILIAAEAQEHVEKALGRALTADEGERFRESLKASLRDAEARRSSTSSSPPLCGPGQGRTCDDMESAGRSFAAFVGGTCIAGLVLTALWLLGLAP